MMSSQRTSSGAPRTKLQRARPPPLKICKESHKIRKPDTGVPSDPSMPIIDRSQPVIVYMQSPKIIHAGVQDFMTLVQRLTGSSSSSETHSCQNLTGDHHSTIIFQASDVTASSLTAESVDHNMGSSRPTDNTSVEIGRNQRIESRVVRAVQPAVGDSSTAPISISPYSPFSPNFLIPSQHFLSPRILKDLPLFSPDSNNFSNTVSEPMFSPP